MRRLFMALALGLVALSGCGKKECGPDGCHIPQAQKSNKKVCVDGCNCMASKYDCKCPGCECYCLCTGCDCPH